MYVKALDSQWTVISYQGFEKTKFIIELVLDSIKGTQ